MFSTTNYTASDLAKAYQHLGLDRHADLKTVKQARDKAALRYHPDKNSSPDATENFQLINASYELILKDRETPAPAWTPPPQAQPSFDPLDNLREIIRTGNVNNTIDALNRLTVSIPEDIVILGMGELRYRNGFHIINNQIVIKALLRKCDRVSETTLLTAAKLGEPLFSALDIIDAIDSTNGIISEKTLFALTTEYQCLDWYDYRRQQLITEAIKETCNLFEKRKVRLNENALTYIFKLRFPYDIEHRRESLISTSIHTILLTGDDQGKKAILKAATEWWRSHRRKWSGNNLVRIMMTAIASSQSSPLQLDAFALIELETKFTSQLYELDMKGDHLNDRGYSSAGAKAHSLQNQLREHFYDYLNNLTETGYETFYQKSHAAIEAARPELEKHRGWKRVLANIALAIVGLGVFYLIAGAIHKKTTGHFLFFNQTDSCKKLDELDQLLATSQPAGRR